MQDQDWTPADLASRIVLCRRAAQQWRELRCTAAAGNDGQGLLYAFLEENRWRRREYDFRRLLAELQEQETGVTVSV